jgi:YedE family putative selenium metabolism protein
MLDRLTRFFASRWGIILTGAVIGILAALLQYVGNPPNMGICVACFERDIAGALGLHRASVVQYIRPEIIAFVMGSTVAALVFKEFKPRMGSAPIVRFVLGSLAMIGALAFLGCPWRALLRLAGGDLNAIVGLLGLITGVSIGVYFLKHGYTLGRSRRAPVIAGWIMPIIMLMLLVLLIFSPKFSEGGPIFVSETGPGSMAAPILLSIFAGLIIGFLAQRSRFCTMGSFRDVFLMRDTHLISGVGALLITTFIINLILGQVKFGFVLQPVAHSNHIWNFLGMVLAGLAFALAGGCPGRQLFLSGEGDGDAGIFVLGMIVGAGISHNFSLAGSPDQLVDGVLKIGGISIWGQIAVVVGIVFCLIIGFTARDRN